MLRKLVEHALVNEAGLTDNDAYFCSLSSRTIVYKGQLTPEQVPLHLCLYFMMYAGAVNAG